MHICTWYTEILGEKALRVVFYQPQKDCPSFEPGTPDDKQAYNSLTYAMPLTRGT